MQTREPGDDGCVQGPRCSGPDVEGSRVNRRGLWVDDAIGPRRYNVHGQVAAVASKSDRQKRGINKMDKAILKLWLVMMARDNVDWSCRLEMDGLGKTRWCGLVGSVHLGTRRLS